MQLHFLDLIPPALRIGTKSAFKSSNGQYWQMVFPLNIILELEQAHTIKRYVILTCHFRLKPSGSEQCTISYCFQNCYSCYYSDSFGIETKRIVDSCNLIKLGLKVSSHTEAVLIMFDHSLPFLFCDFVYYIPRNGQINVSFSFYKFRCSQYRTKLSAHFSALTIIYTLIT